MARAIHVFRSPDRFVAGTVGQPGDRTFYLQAVHETRIISVMLEKQQVEILADRIGALLEEIHRRFGTPIPPQTDRVGDISPLVMPVDAEFRVGTMGLGWDAEAEAVVVELLALTDGEFDESVVLDDTDEGPDAVRVFLSTQAAREFAARSSKVLSAGRRPCPLCAEPLDPTGHLCVRTNGYKRDAQLSKSLDFIDPEVLNSLAAQGDPRFLEADDEFGEQGTDPADPDVDDPDSDNPDSDDPGSASGGTRPDTSF
ncbi:DUF3090 domain-containing protein [Gordonia sp. ABSL1-1]|uniref:DUF3090 domain-containing protein n=1 Tax=Gordonia sp. ABSL1-1 TaxID=3053923 RepID=UPI002572F4E5|nr:DUF3090 domain-containing protein [Gordonia sp. ABSL1-1]MDL9935883.1 DUF3090 domain-containing protein [Gordonia sp. ABSL1-1]